MLNCPKCGADNLLTAIFCRNCGERLELAEIKPDTVAKAAPKASLSDRVNKILGYVLSVIIIILLIAILLPVSGTNSNATPSEEAKASFNKLVKGSKDTQSLTFTTDEASACLNEALAARESKELLKPKSVGFTCKEDGSVKIVMTNKLFFIPIHVVVNAVPSVPDKGKLELEVKSARLGYLPIPAGIRKSLNENFVTAVRGTASPKFKFQEVKLEEGKITLAK